MREFTFEAGHESEFQWLHLVVLETLLGATVHRLLAVEQVRSRIPNITHIVDTELISSVIFRYEDVAFIGRLTNLHKTYSGIFQYLFYFFLMLVAYLDNNTRVLGKQELHEVVFLHLVEIDFHTTFYIGEAHFE